MPDVSPLLNHNSPWVRTTLESMSLNQKIGQLLHPFLMPRRGIEESLKTLEDIEVGGVFFFPENKAVLQELSDKVQKRSQVPVIVSSDLENGAGRMVDGAVTFPDNMAVAATNDEAFAGLLGEAAAKEGRECGIHWSFGPVVDINKNPNNPITNTRSFGDDQATIERMSLSMIKGMQDNGLAACAKHFPGDGFDDRDQHLCTTINPLPFDEWKKTSGQLFQSAIDSGVWTIMIGHIALPSVDPGTTGKLIDAPPAVLSYKLTTELLRHEMGFEGVIISDAIGMGGSCSHYPETEVVIRSIEAGCDMVLFVNPRDSFDGLKDAVASGRISESRIDESVCRILALKEKMNLNNDTQVQFCSDQDKARFLEGSKTLARQALTLVKNELAADALPLKAGMKVLSMHIRGDALYNVDGLDDLLRARGIEVVRWSESDDYEMNEWKHLDRYDAILINTVFGPTWATNRIRLAGNFNRPISDVMKAHHPKVIFTSFGSPYHIYDYPKMPCYLNAYAPDTSSQEAVVDFLFGDLDAKGVSPVDIDKLLGG